MDDMSVESLSGEVIIPISEKSDFLETLKKIELMNITKDEKDLLLIVTQMAEKKEKEHYVIILNGIIESGTIYEISNSKIIQEKINKINNKEKNEVINIASNLKKYLENDEIIL